MIMLSEKAVHECARIIKEQNLGKVFLRVGVKGGGCSGFSYTLGFDDKKSAADQISTSELLDEDFEIVCDPKSFLYLNNTIIDFADGLMSRGFTFVNPNAKKTCGCGESFSA